MLLCQIILLFEPCQVCEQMLTWGGVRWCGDAISKRRAEGLPPVTILLFLLISKRMTFSLFSPKSFNIWSILMANLLLHILPHLLTYNAVQTVRSLTSYSTKNSNSGTVRKDNSFNNIQMPGSTMKLKQQGFHQQQEHQQCQECQQQQEGQEQQG